MVYYDIEKSAASPRANSPQQKRRSASCLAIVPAIVWSFFNRIIWFLHHTTAGKILLLLATVYVTIAVPFYLFSFELGELRLSNPCSFLGDGSKMCDQDDGFNPLEAPTKLLQSGKSGRQNERLPFQWRDWIDLAVAYDWENADILPFSEKKGDLLKYSFPMLKPYTQGQQAMLGKVYLDNLAEIPDKIVFLGKSKASFPLMSYRNRNFTGFFGDLGYEGTAKMLEEQEKKKQEEEKKKEENKKEEEEEKAKRATTEDMSKVELTPLYPALSKDKPLKDRIFVRLTMENFIFNIDDLQKVGPDSTEEQKRHATFIKAARPLVNESKKHFYEVSLANDLQGFGEHYDWRFFNFVRHDKEGKQIMHHLMRAWSQFAEQENILYWIAHGSLLGWYWNGISMPWDNDIDIQMPVQELDRFARIYNGTLVVEDEIEGTGRYLIDVSPWYIEREQGNGKNVIDARFIDIRSGIYIDITGLALVRDDMQVSCKNHHSYPLSRLSPLRKTLYEGSSVYIPHDYESILYQEYPKYRDTEFQSYVFNRDLRMWVNRDTCEKYKQRNLKFDDRNELTMYGACDREDIFNDYQHTKEITLVHSQEIDLYNHYGMIDAVDVNDKSLQPQIASKLAELLDRYYEHQLPGAGQIERFSSVDNASQAQ